MNAKEVQNWKITATTPNTISKCLSILNMVETFKTVKIDFPANTAIIMHSDYPTDFGEHALKVCSRNGERFIFEKP